MWPLSTPDRPKQFLSLVSERSLFQETLLRLAGLPDLADPIIVCNEAHRFLVAEQLSEIDMQATAIVLEPERRNTAPAIAVAALLSREPARQAGATSPLTPVANEPTLLVLPADHVIKDSEAFRAAVGCAVEAAGSGRLVTFGVVPTFAETGYGYIEQGTDEGRWSSVGRFVEKPDRRTAERYLETDGYLWNSGMFAFSAQTYLAELARHAPEIAAACKSAVAEAHVDQNFVWLGPSFADSPSDSIDYAVMENSNEVAVVPLAAGWSDVGSWGALYDVLRHDSNGNALRGNVVTLDTGESLVVSGSRKVALLGVDNVIVIVADGAVLVMNRHRSQDVKTLIRQIEGDES